MGEHEHNWVGYPEHCTRCNLSALQACEFAEERLAELAALVAAMRGAIEHALNGCEFRYHFEEVLALDAPALVRRYEAAQRVADEAQSLTSCPCTNRPHADYDGPQIDCPKHGQAAETWRAAREGAAR